MIPFMSSAASAGREGARIAYFSMEIGVDPELPTYSGGLGVLAGDTLLAAADVGLPVVGMTLLHRQGTFRQVLDASGGQSEEPQEWVPEDRLQRLDARVSVVVEGRTVELRAFRLDLTGARGHVVPVFFLDADLPANSAADRKLTDQLYGGDLGYRLAQEVILGTGGLRMLRTLGYQAIQAFHMNEGHSALLALGLLEERATLADATDKDIEAVRGECIFTTHTPVPAGHDRFPIGLVERLCCHDGELNMTELALHFSRFINGVSMRHEKISSSMFPSYPIDSITNGVHAVRWTSQPFRDLFDRKFPEWRRDNFSLRYAAALDLTDIVDAHRSAKGILIDEIRRRTGTQFDAATFTIGFARRAATYKRAGLVFSDIDRLAAIAGSAGAIQLVFAGKAHPVDDEGKAIIRRVFDAARELRGRVTVAYLEDYDMILGGHLTAGVDVWLNTPRKPEEASGTSGMKSALNGVPSFSVLDGWWVEGCVEGVTGWKIGNGWQYPSDVELETESLYDKLENVILPMYYGSPDDYARIMRSCVALNGSFFNAQRMVTQYIDNAYTRARSS